MLLISFENIFVIALFVMEGPAAVLAPVLDLSRNERPFGKGVFIR